MKVKVNKLTPAPQLYGYTVYVPNPKAADGTFASICNQRGYMGLLHADLPIVKSNYLHLCNGQLYGKRDDVINHIWRTHMVPSGGVIQLVSQTSNETAHYINDLFGFFKLHRFEEG